MQKPSKTMPCAMNSWFWPFQKKSEIRCQNGSPILWKMKQNPSQGRQGSIYSWILMILCRVEKSLFFRWRFGPSKNRKNRALGGQRLEKSLRDFAEWGVVGSDGPRGGLARTVKDWKKRGNKEQGTVKKDLTHQWPMARRILCLLVVAGVPRAFFNSEYLVCFLHSMHVSMIFDIFRSSFDIFRTSPTPPRSTHWPGDFW